MTTAVRGREQSLRALVNVREERGFRGRVEFRDKSDGSVVASGYAATFDPYDVNGGPEGGGWVEQLRSNCFDQTLAERPDVQLLVNHEGLPLARTKSGTLALSVDRRGLRWRASLDTSDPDVQRLIPKMRRGDLDECSFAFRVQDQDWNSSYSHRSIRRLSLHKGDVSLVNFGMNPRTSAALSNDAIDVLARLSAADLAEVRSLDRSLVHRAAAVLQSLAETPAYPIGAVRTPTAASQPVVVSTCRNCGGLFDDQLPGVYCSAACRENAHRMLRRPAPAQREPDNTMSVWDATLALLDETGKYDHFNQRMRRV